jgi:hypothetical protein
MIAAERLLLASALEDPSNQRFVLLSDSCVPLYDFGYIYRYLVSSPKSFVDSFLDKDNRYTMKMFPVIRKEKWRKGSQWISLIRSHAEVIVNDDTVFPVFQKFCKRSLPLDPRKNWLYLKKRRHNCIPDEHYVQTLLTVSTNSYQNLPFSSSISNPLIFRIHFLHPNLDGLFRCVAWKMKWNGEQ